MSKLQPNFSWQKYEVNSENDREQFQYQLQQEHILIANALNSTIDDLSYWTRERKTGFTFTDGRPIYTKTFTGTLTGTNNNATAHNISNFNTLVRLFGTAQNATPWITLAVPLPYLDPATLANSAGISVDSTKYYITLPNNTLNGYTYSLTIEYTKVS